MSFVDSIFILSITKNHVSLGQIIYIFRKHQFPNC
nr:MAG TPA: hypothetical protein [Bacteriophage sp.]